MSSRLTVPPSPLKRGRVFAFQHTDAVDTVENIFRYALSIFSCLTILAVFVPLNPSMPTSGLDTSWMFAMNQGITQGLVFGKDIVFTFGPYASVYTELYQPATDSLMVGGALFLGLSFALLLLLLAKGKMFHGLLLFCISLACLTDSRDALFFSYPLILALVVYRMTLPIENEIKLHLATSLEYGSIFFFAPLGLLPLIKGSLLPICGSIAILCGGMFWFRGKKILAGFAIGIPVISCILFWNFSGQPISALPSFLWSVRQFVTGYTDAMSFPGNVSECVLYILASALILLVIFWTANSPRLSKCFLCIAYALFLFTAFKAGFVRHDPWHNIIAGSSLLAAALLLMFVLGEKRSVLPLAMALLVWAYIGHGPVRTTAEDISANLRGTFGQAIESARMRWKGSDNLQQRFNERVAAIKAEFPVPRMSGTTDIYSFNQSWIFASGNTWAPRPVTQSYSAYTPELARLNLRHLEGASAPDNILFRVEPIDGRLPSLEDGLSWPALINSYSLQKLEGQTAYLRKRTTSGNQNAGMTEDFNLGSHALGEEVALPESGDPLFANIDIQPTLLGKVWGALYKLPELHIAMRLRDGETKNYRVISNMMRTDFLITPLVQNTEDFVLLRAGGNKYLTDQEAMSITISSGDHAELFSNKSYSLRVRKLNLSITTDAENSLVFDKMDEVVPGSLSASSERMCEGMIEAVNGTSPRSGIPTVRNALSVQGWMAISGKDGLVPDHVFVTMKSDSGKTIYVNTHSMRRNDIRRHFNQPGMPDPGYTALADVSSLSGHFTLGLAETDKGKLSVCQQFKLPILIAH
jgi:hypothetical protein